MRVGVTGAFGYVGARLVARLLDAGHEVSAVSLEPPASDLPQRVAGIPTRIADITDAAALAGGFEGCDAVVHAAGLPAAACTANPALALHVNGFGTRAVLDEAVRAGVRRVVYLSTSHVYGRETGTIDESLPTRPTADYGISKAAGEGQVCTVANDNDPSQVVISGAREAIERAINIAKEYGAKRAVLLPVSAPFHCPLMQPAADAMEKALAEARIDSPLVPVFANVTAQPVSDPDTIRRLLVEQVTGMVRWRESVLAMADTGVERFVEFGGKVLAPMVRRIVPDVEAVSVITMDDIEGLVKTL